MAMTSVDREPSPAAAPLELYELVRLVERSAESGDLPEGAIGTVVYRHNKGAAFEVEFDVAPEPRVVTLEARQVRRLA